MVNEFREDLVSGEWVLFATGRAQRPEQVKQEKPKTKTLPKSKCPFENPEKYGNIVVAEYLNKERNDWAIKVVKNKYPAVLEGKASLPESIGPFNVQEAKGRHEVVIFRNHDRFLHEFSKEELAEALKVYQERYRTMTDGGAYGKYALIFHNHGSRAGASMSHPHSQIISIPVLPPDVKRSINGSEKFYREYKKRIYNVMIDWERKERKRIVYENKYFIAFCPFVSKTSYEVRIFPQESHAHFEKMPEEQLVYLGEILLLILKKIQLALKNPDYNFFVHTAPLEDTVIDVHDFYTWHVEVLPKISTFGAFELGSGIDVNIIDPDEAAKLLRETDPIEVNPTE
ncbi:MAG: galactose-1-phosphate uridylyltransferase [Candidatus Yanofskybacteria bacterium]|nr:galactose-1-phosphate uridylyltransferase [Candidatus Yanofskybacteria bacterium]